MFEQLKIDVCRANKELVALGLVILTWGNASAIDRKTGIIGIKPSGVAYEKLRPKDIVLVDLNGKLIEGNLRPSSDTPTHIEIYKSFPEINAIIHTHASHTTMFAQSKKPIECLGTTHADYFYGPVPVIDDLKEYEVNVEYEKNTGIAIVKYFKKKGLSPLQMPACLVPSHGPFIWAKSLGKAVYYAVVLEEVAKMNRVTLKINPNAKKIDQFLLDKHYLRKHGKSAYYGQKKE